MMIYGRKIKITGRFLKTARLELEWDEKIEDPPAFIEILKSNKVEADIFTFWQLIPETKPKYNYYMEWDPVAVLSITSFDNWRTNQIDGGAKWAISKAERAGVIVKLADFSDEFIRGVESIFNETPIRQGRPYPHYGADFGKIKSELSKDIHKYTFSFIGAYYKDELIGFIQLGMAGRYAIPFGMVSKIAHRDKSINNALIAKAVEVCVSKKISYFIYGKWTSGSLTEFKRHNGFRKVDLPRYYVPLTLKGEIVLKLRLHKGIRGIIPERLKSYLIRLRTIWYSIFYGRRV